MNMLGRVVVAAAPVPPTISAPIAAPPIIMRSIASPNIVNTVPLSPVSVVDASRIPSYGSYTSVQLGSVGSLATQTTAQCAVASAGGGAGQLTAALGWVCTTQVGLATTGALQFAVVVGSGATVVVPTVQFSGGGMLTAGDAILGGTGALSVAVTATATMWAAFGGSGTATATAKLLAVAPPYAATGALSATVLITPSYTASGTLAAAVVPPQKPAGMIMASSPTTAATWTQIAGWVPDTTNYPGSNVTTDALVATGVKTSATISASISWTSFGSNVAIRINKNGAPIATGVASSTSPAQLTTTTSVNPNDRITVDAQDAGSFFHAAITGNSTSYVHLT